MATLEGVDLSRLQQHTPLRKLHLSLVDLMKYVSVGTSELLLYLLKETHVILECRACSNLFRDVPYLVAHKRFYCTQKCDFDFPNHQNPQGPPPPKGDLVAFFQAESPLNEKDFLKHSVELAKKNLQNSQVESCIRQDAPTKRQFYDAVQKQLEVNRASSLPVRSYSFERLENTDIAMKVVSNNEGHQENTDPDSCNQTKDGFQNNRQNIEFNKTDSCGENFNLSTSSSSNSSLSSSSQNSENKNESTSLKPNLCNDSSEYRSLHCFKCNSTMASQKAMSIHQSTVHFDNSRNHSGHTCGESNTLPAFPEHSQQKLNGMQNKIRKTDWLKPKGFMSTVDKIPPKTQNCNSVAKDLQEAKKKAQATLNALKVEQLAYENEILQQKLIRGIIPKSSRGRKKFQCESCSKIFSKIQNLKDHMRYCIDWEHDSQQSRNLKLPLPAVSDTNGPSLPMSAPASVEWPDTSSDGTIKPPTSGPQFFFQDSKSDNSGSQTVPPKSTAQQQDKFPIKVQNINGVNKSAIESSLQGLKVKKNEILALNSASTNNPNKPDSPNPSSPLQLYANHPKIGDTSVVKSPLLAANMRTNHNPVDSSSCTSNVVDKNPQNPVLTNCDPTKGPVEKSLKDIEIIAINPPIANNGKTVTSFSKNSKQTSVIQNTKISPHEQVKPVPCNCLQCKTSIVKLANSVNTSSPSLLPNRCQDCVECQKSNLCSSACCVKDVEIVMELTPPPSEGASNKFSMPSCSYKQKTPSNNVDDVIITSHNFTRLNSQNSSLGVITPNVQGPPKIQNLKQPPNTSDDCVLVSFSTSNDQVSDPLVKMPDSLCPSHVISNSQKATSCHSFMKPIIWHQYKCKFCLFTHKTFLGCKLHLKKKHAQKIRACSIQCINHYIIDLKCPSRKSCCLFPGKRCKPLQYSKLISAPSTGILSPDKEMLQIHKTRIVRRVSKTDKSDVANLMNTKTRQCLECKHKFKKLSNLRVHVLRHVGRKDFQCKSCSLLKYSKSECRSHIKRQHLGKVKGITLKNLDRFIIDLKQTQTDSSSAVKSPMTEDDSTSKIMSETDSKPTTVLPTPAKLNDPQASLLSVLSTRKGIYQKQDLPLETKAKSTKKSIKKNNS